MEKIYGYKEKDVMNFAEFIKNRGNESLSETFEKYAIKSKKAKGTVRNLYYALAKRSNKDQEFCEKYLGGKPISVGSIIEFDSKDEKELITKVLLGKKEGRSVRSVIMEMAGGDGKTALRYQNKYRNAVKNKPQMVSKIIAEIKGDEELLLARTVQKVKNYKENSHALELALIKIKSEINSLMQKETLKTRKENEYLKERISALEEENLRLNNILYGSSNPKAVLKLLNRDNGKSLLS
ncbi:MAG: hypothetical protein IJB32_02710 [Clostridia bacterium]|nr:hypothetical protein [Clostridia bacterium]